jgi:outer membrane protein
VRSKLFAVLMLGAAAQAAAQTATDLAAPEPAAPNARALPLWELGVIGGGLSTPAYPGASVTNRRALALPYFIYRGEVVRAEQGGVDARLLRTDFVEVNIGAAGSLPADSEDVAIRRGMPDLGTLLEFGPQAKFMLARPSAQSRVHLDVPLRAVIEARGGLRNQGAVFEPRLVYDMRGAGWTLSANAGVLFGTEKLNRYFYGVAPQYATAGRAAYEAKGGYMLSRLGLWLSKDVTPDGRLYGFVRYDNYGGAANRASPLFQQGHGLSVGVGVAWTLMESQRGGTR